MTRGRPFQPGNRFGRGRPPGNRNKAGQAAQATRQLLEQYAEPLIRKCILDALKGDKQAMRMCLERLIPLCRERLLQMPAPRIGTARQLAHAVEKVWKSMGSGECTPGEAEKIVSILQHRGRVLETQELERRVEQLEDQRRAA